MRIIGSRDAKFRETVENWISPKVFRRQVKVNELEHPIRRSRRVLSLFNKQIPRRVFVFLTLFIMRVYIR